MTRNICREILLRKVDEIISSDKRCCEIDKAILELEHELLSTLSSEARRTYLQIESLSFELLNHVKSIIIHNICININESRTDNLLIY